MNRGKQIAKNTIIFFIGNFGSKILMFLMVLLYTHYIDTSDLGYYDLVITTIGLLQPIILMALDEGIYRWLIDNSDKKQEVIISTCTKFVLFTSVLTAIFILILNIWFRFKYVLWVLLLIISTSIYQLFLNVVRGLSNNKTYAFSGILNTSTMLLIELPSLVFFGFGVEALFIARIIANIIAIVYLFIKEKILRNFSYTSFDKNLFYDLIHYSIPLVPNQLSWWIVNSSDKYIIAFFLGTSFNGIYSVSTKFPTVVTTITGIIYLSLQETIIKEYFAADRDNFYSNVFQKYYTILFSMIMCAIPLTKIVINYTVSIEYLDAWMYMPLLYIGTVFSALSSFLGIGYQISKETSRSVFSTSAAALVNIIINIVTIKYIGLHAASFSTFISYFTLFVVRILHSKKYFSLKIQWKHFCELLLSVTCISIITYISNVGINLLLFIISIFASLIVNKQFIKSIIVMYKQRVAK